MDIPVEKIDHQNMEDILSLSPMQESMLFQYLKEPGSRMYFEQTCYEVTGNGWVDAGKLREAWNAVASGNEMLRTVFRWQGLKKPVQIILKNHTVPIKEIDLFPLSAEDQQYQLDKIKTEDRQNRLNLSREPFRVILCKITGNRYEMIISNHHIIYDGWSNVIILKELAEAYNQFYLGKKWSNPGKSKYKEYIKWQRQQDTISQRDYWQNYLKGFTDLTPISPAFSSSGHKPKVFTTVEEKRREYPLARDLVKKIADFSRDTGITLAVLLYGIWAILLHKYNDKEDVVFGITISGRDSRIKGIQDMVGLFINTLPLRLHISPGDEIGAFLKKVKKVLRGMETFESTPMAEIMAFSEIGRKDALFDSVVVIQNYPLDEAWFKEESQLRISLTTRFYMTNISLSLGVRAFERVILDFSYNANVFNERHIENLSNHLVTVLETIVTNPVKGRKNPAKNLEIKDIKLLEQRAREKMMSNIRENRKKLAEIDEVNFDEIF